MTHCTVKFTQSRLGPSAYLIDKHGHSVNTINWPKGTKLTKQKKEQARRRLMQDCSRLSQHDWSLGGLFDGEISPVVAGAAALAGGLLIFNLVRTADPNAG